MCRISSVREREIFLSYVLVRALLIETVETGAFSALNELLCFARREQALNRMRDLAYLEGIGALASRGGSREIYQALKLSKMKIAEQISILSPKKSKDLSLDRSVTTDTVQSSLSDLQASKEQTSKEQTSKEQTSKALPSENPSKSGQEAVQMPQTPQTPQTPLPVPEGKDDKASTAPARLMQRGIEIERNNAAAKSVLRLAGDLLQANGSGQPIRHSQRSAFLRSPKQRLAKSVSDGHIKFNWARQKSMDLQASLTLEEKAWWWPCAPKGVTSPVKVSQNSSHLLTR